MLLRNGKVVKNPRGYYYFENSQNGYFDKLRYFTNIYLNVHNSYLDNEHYDRQRAYIINAIYSLIYDKFEEIHNEILTSSSKKEVTFHNLINVLEKRGKILLNELELSVIKRTTLKKTIKKTLQKISDYKKKYETEKNNQLCLVSCKVGNDLIKYIASYL
jgi:hypothetical protein